VKRKVGLFLLAVILAVMAGATFVVSLTMYRLVTARQNQEIGALETSLSRRFTTFEKLLHTEYDRIKARMARVLPLVALDISRLAPAPDAGSLTGDELDALARTYGLQDLYLIDRSHRIFLTNLASDQGLVFPASGFTRFLDGVYGKGTVMDVGIDIAEKTGALNAYTYFGPVGQDYIIEASTGIEESLAGGDFAWMGKFFFKDMFTDAVASSAYVEDVDLYLVNDAGAWSLLHQGQKLAPEIVQRIGKDGRYELPSADGRLVTLYSVDDSERYTEQQDAARRVIRKITYDVSPAREAVESVVVGSLVVLALALPLAFWLAMSTLRRQMLDPLFTLRAQAQAIAAGDLDLAIADTGRRDEIGNLASSFAVMRDAIRRTISDLKETNAAIERFVPRAFLALIGKRSIVSVKLGDNRRMDLTVLFSDIRNFTGLSEQMTPDENFAFINSYLERMGPVIRMNNGFIDKYIGDAIMALFERAEDALSAGYAMLDALEAYNRERRDAGREPVRIGIGINSGSLMLGTIGEKDRMDGTVISDAVNLAARVESLTKTYGTGFLVSESTYRALADPEAFDLRPIDVVVVKGKTRAVAVFECFRRDAPPEHALKARTRTLLLSGVEALSRQEKAEARRIFEQSLREFPGDAAAANLLKRCA